MAISLGGLSSFRARSMGLGFSILLNFVSCHCKPQTAS